MLSFTKKIKNFDPIIIFEKIGLLLELFNTKRTKLLTFIALKIDKAGELLSSITLKRQVYKFFRYISWPWHYIVIFIWILYKKFKKDSLIYDKPGIHIIFGVPGSGKSSLSYELIERIRQETKLKPSYINYPFEKKRLSEDQEYYFKYHQVYDFSDFFSYNIMKKRPNHLIFGAMVIDEAHSVFNPRNNKTTEYNDVFGPFIDFAVKVRQHIGHIFMLTQMGRMDIQIMMLATTITEVDIDIGFDYPDWLKETGLFRFKPLGWTIKSYQIDSFGNIEQKKFKKFYVKNKYANFDYFDSFATRNDYNHVAMDYPTNYRIERI